MLDLTPNQLTVGRGLLARYVCDREVRAFGSRVTGRARRWSDLDLVVMGRKALSDLVLAHLRGPGGQRPAVSGGLAGGARSTLAWANGFDSASASVSVYPANPSDAGSALQ
jgi:hypothetical protein